MKRSLVLLAVMIAPAGCSFLQPTPVTVVRVDTVIVTREVPPPLPQGDSIEICLSTGVPARVLVSATGDTLVGDARVSLAAVRPLLSLAGMYAESQPWYQRADTLRFEKRLYRRTGPTIARSCEELKHVGSHEGLPIFAEVTAPQALPFIVIPVRPGIFQVYSVPTPQRRR